MLYQSTNLPVISDPNDRNKIAIALLDLLTKINHVYDNVVKTNGTITKFPNGYKILTGQVDITDNTQVITFDTVFNSIPSVQITLISNFSDLTQVACFDILKTGFTLNAGAYGGSRKINYIATGV